MNIETVNSVCLYDTFSSFEKLYKAYLDTKKSKRWKNSTIRYEINALTLTQDLAAELQNGTYEMAPYNVFDIYEPKHRVIKSIKFRDKIVQRSVCDNVLEPCFERVLIYDNFACRKGKGTHAGLKRTGEFLQKHYRQYGTEGWILKCDIEKYFDSIDHDILKYYIAKYVPCTKVCDFLNTILDGAALGGKGLPLGNQTSQWFAVMFLNAFDHFVKEVLKVKMYIRYMDDFVLIHPDKAYLQYCKKETVKFLAGMKLKLNNKSHIFPIKNGADFLGFHIYITDTGKIVKKLRYDSVKRIKRKLKKYKVLYREGKRTKFEIEQSYNSWRNHAKHGDCFNLIKKMDQLYDSIFDIDVKGACN